jgi:hypothetical protein
MGIVDTTIQGLSRKKFATDPIVAPRYSAITSIVSSAYKRQGRIIEEALAVTLRCAGPVTLVAGRPSLCVIKGGL